MPPSTTDSGSRPPHSRAERRSPAIRDDPPPVFMRPVAPAERIAEWDVLRGAALLGVLMVNLLFAFRVSLFESMLTFHTHPGWANHTVDLLTAWVFEFKSFTLLSLLFGIGMGFQVERAEARVVHVSRFFFRRFLALFAIGLCHMLLIWNGDILALYAVCGMLVIPLAGIPARWQAALGASIVVMAPYLPLFGGLLPAEPALRAHAAIATRVYATGSWTAIMAFRSSQALHFIAPLLLDSLPRTSGLILIGLGAWRSGVLRCPSKRRGLLKFILVACGGVGAITTTLHVWSKQSGRHLPGALGWVDAYSAVMLAFAYGAGLLLLLGSAEGGRGGGFTGLLAAAGRTALTNYLAQSVIFSLLFYGFGFGLFGKMGPAAAALLGVAVFGAQLAASQWWLQRFSFGPAEWFWRLLTYGRGNWSLPRKSPGQHGASNAFEDRR